MRQGVSRVDGSVQWWGLRYFLLEASRCVNSHLIQMKLRADVGSL